MSRVDVQNRHEAILDMPHQFVECDCPSTSLPPEHCWFCGEERDDDGRHL